MSLYQCGNDNPQTDGTITHASLKKRHIWVFEKANPVFPISIKVRISFPLFLTAIIYTSYNTFQSFSHKNGHGHYLATPLLLVTDLQVVEPQELECFNRLVVKKKHLEKIYVVIMVNIWLIYMVNRLLMMVNHNLVNIWLMMVNNHLLGGIPNPMKNDGVKVSGDDDYSQ